MKIELIAAQTLTPGPSPILGEGSFHLIRFIFIDGCECISWRLLEREGANIVQNGKVPLFLREGFRVSSWDRKLFTQSGRSLITEIDLPS
jgi:hypothetical protein